MNLNSLQNALERFTGTGLLRDATRELFVTIAEANKTNYRAVIKSRDLELKILNFDCDWKEDYEIVTGSFEEVQCPDGSCESFISEAAREAETDIWQAKLEKEEELLEGYRERSDAASASLAIAEGDDAPDNSVIAERLEALKLAESAIPGQAEIVERIETYLSDLQSAEWNYDEVGTKWMYRFYNDEPDIEICNRLGLGILRKTDTDEGWIFHCGGGMDLRGKIAAYAALEHGAVDYSHEALFEDIDYVKHVIGDEVYAEVAKIIGIDGCEKETYEASDRRMRQFDDQLANLKALRDLGIGRAALAVLAAATVASHLDD